MANYISQLSNAAGSKASSFYSNAADPRIRKAEERKMIRILENPPAPSASASEHTQYRIDANEALQWLEYYLSPEDYQHYRGLFKDYLKKNTPQGDGKWSNRKFTHQYSSGAGNMLGGPGTALRMGLNADRALSVPTEAERNRLAHNDREMDVLQEAFYRGKHKIEHTPPSSPTNSQKKPELGEFRFPSTRENWKTTVDYYKGWPFNYGSSMK